MTTVSYEIIGLATARERELPGSVQFALFTDMDDWNSGIWRCEDGVPVEYVGDDICEPEDSVLRRDWGWVAKALQAAYERGLADGGEGSMDDEA